PHSRPRRPRRCDSPSPRSTASLATTWTCCPAPTSPSSKPRRSRSPHSSSREARGQSSRARARPPPKPPSPPPTSSPRRSKTDSEEKHMAVDVYRGTSNIALPADVSSEIWAKVQDASVVMGLARKVTLPGTGVTFQEILTDPTPAFVGETDRKPVSNPTFAKKVLKPHKIAVVSTYSDEFRRDLPGLFNELLRRLPGALAKTFDLAALHGTGAPMSDFDDLSGATTQTIVNTTPGTVDAYAGFLAALGLVPDLNAWAFAPAAEIIALGNRDTAGLPIFTNSAATDGSV